MSISSANKTIEIPAFPADFRHEGVEEPFDPWPRNLEKGKSTLEHFSNIESLKESASNGCGLCLQFVQNGSYLHANDKPHTNYTTDGDFAIHCLEDGFNPESGVLLTLDLFRFSYSEKGRNLEKHVWRAKAFLVPEVQPALIYDPDASTSAPHALLRCKAWLQKCISSHTCFPSVDAGSTKCFLPTRLIAIYEKEPRLCVNTVEIPEGTSYASLSHCWGSLKFLNLTTETLAEFIGCIPHEKLPKTFQDAIYIARYLDFKYIWIDSLCIIQDSPEDWRQESKSMGSVYGYSALNIAATSASDGTIGCFFDRKADWRCQVRLGTSKLSPLHECFTPELLEPPAEQIPLLQRAWVVQERFLSVRTLHFTKEQIFWVCRNVTACEVWPDGIPNVKRYLTCSLDIPKGNWLTRASWPDIVNKYSSCNLTYGRDKLVAVSALAKIVQNECRDDYIAGLWRTDIVEQLGWSISGYNGTRISPYVAPTWSWASNAAEATYVYPYCSPSVAQFVHVENVHLEHTSSDNPLGEVASGKLEVRCQYLKECTAVSWPSSTKKEIDASVEVDGRRQKWQILFDSVDDHPDFKPFRGFYLPLVTKVTVVDPISSGLMLQPSGVRKGEYKRVGWVSEGWRRTFPASDLLPVEENCVRTSINEDGEKEYFIDIV